MLRKCSTLREIECPQKKKKNSLSFYALVLTEKDAFKFSLSLQIPLHGFEDNKGVAFK